MWPFQDVRKILDFWEMTLHLFRALRLHLWPLFYFRFFEKRSRKIIVFCLCWSGESCVHIRPDWLFLTKKSNDSCDSKLMMVLFLHAGWLWALDEISSLPSPQSSFPSQRASMFTQACAWSRKLDYWRCFLKWSLIYPLACPCKMCYLPCCRI